VALAFASSANIAKTSGDKEGVAAAVPVAAGVVVVPVAAGVVVVPVAAGVVAVPVAAGVVVVVPD
jgi:hypothetical protein